MNEPMYTREQVEAMIREAHSAGFYAAQVDEGHYLAKTPEGDLIPTEDDDAVVERLLGTRETSVMDERIDL